MAVNVDTFTVEGFAIVRDVLHARACRAIVRLTQPASGHSGGTRNLLTYPWCAALARRLRRHHLLEKIIPASHVAVQCTYFEKSTSRNWLVPFHQDLSIPVTNRVQHSDLRGWSEKEGSCFVHGPIEVLEQLVTVRLHLEDCTMHDGPLRLIPGTHTDGQIQSEAAIRLRTERGEFTCNAEQGTALVMRPLVLHVSSKATGMGRRRVLHFVFGPRLLSHGLRWQYAV